MRESVLQCDECGRRVLPCYVSVCYALSPCRQLQLQCFVLWLGNLIVAKQKEREGRKQLEKYGIEVVVAVVAQIRGLRAGPLRLGAYI